MTISSTPERLDHIPNVRDWAKAEELFYIRYKYAVKSAHGMERLAFKVLPYSLLRSFALTFDPLEPFRLGNQKISPVNRTLTRKITSVLASRRSEYRNKGWSWSKQPNASLCFYVPEVENRSSSGFDIANTKQSPLSFDKSDTTRRTRKPDQNLGELVLFKYSLSCPDRSVYRYDSLTSCNTNDTCNLPGLSRSRTDETRRTVGGAAYIPDSTIATVRANAITATNTIMTNNLSKMVTATLPNARRYTLARNVFELKDLPRSILSLKGTMEDLGQALNTMPSRVKEAFFNAKLPEHVPNEWLSFWFGWMSTYRAVKDLLEAPKKIAKEVNFLIMRRGKPTTLRRTVKIPGGTMVTPGWIFQPTAYSGTLWTETAIETPTVNTFETELRLVINLLFDFPEVGVPKIRSSLLERKWGTKPTLSDVYAVIPWTWLVDWFTGLGNYVDLIDAINTDKNLYNWGMITGVTRGQLRSVHRTHYDNSLRYAFRHNSGTVQNTQELIRVNTTTTAIMDYTVQIRKDLVNGFGVRSTLKPASMTPYQQSIVGALLAQRSGLARL